MKPFARRRVGSFGRTTPTRSRGAELALRECTSLDDPTGETHHLIGVAQFLQQEYGLAKENLQIALKANPHNGDWRAILQRSTRNDLNKIGEGIEPTDLFDNTLVARPAALYMREPVDITPLPRAASGVAALYRAVQDVGGAIEMAGAPANG